MIEQGIRCTCDLCSEKTFCENTEHAKKIGFVIMTVGNEINYRDKCVCPICVKLIKQHLKVGEAE